MCVIKYVLDMKDEMKLRTVSIPSLFADTFNTKQKTVSRCRCMYIGSKLYILSNWKKDKSRV